MRTVRLFVSSPSDTLVERARVERVVSRLNGAHAGVVRFAAMRWESAFYTAADTFQAQIPQAAECDIVVAIFKARLGTPLPTTFAHMPDGERYPSGTAYEVLTAIDAAKTRSFPDVYVFRRAVAPLLALDDPQRLDIEHEWERLKKFFGRWFVSPEGEFRAAFNTFSTSDDFEEQLEKLLRGWISDKVLGERAVAWPIERFGSPFRGLASFGAKHADVFFGRSREIERGVDAWIEAARRGTAWLLVTGLSGAGKSSLARAGLVPRLIKPGVVSDVEVWRVVSMRPGEHPLGDMARRLFDDDTAVAEEDAGTPAALPELAQGDHRTPAELERLLSLDADAAVTPILRALERAGEAERMARGAEKPPAAALAIIVDQLDELFATAAPVELERFAALLAALARTGRVWIVATLRAEMTAAYLELPAFRALKESGAEIVLGPPGPAELTAIVREPAEAAGLVFERDASTGERVDERLLAEADKPDMLPLVQLALDKLFSGRIQVGRDVTLPWKAYGTGLAGLINAEAEAAMARLDGAARAGLPRLLRRLVQSAHDGVISIRSAPMAEVATDDSSRRLVAGLVDARILLTDREGVRIAHQRVLEGWERARRLVAENVEFYRVRDSTEESRRRYEEARRDPDLLLGRGKPLADAEHMLVRFPDEIDAPLVAYVRASGTKARRAQRLTAVAAGVFGLVAIAAGVLGYFANHQTGLAQERLAQVERERNAAAEARQRADEQRALADRAREQAELRRREAEAQRAGALLAESRLIVGLGRRALTDGDHGTALALSLEALPGPGRERPYEPQAELLLTEALDGLREHRSLIGHTWVISGGQFSVDGKTVLTASWDWRARLWNAETGELIRTFAHDGAVNRAHFLPGDRRIVTASSDGTSRVFDVESGRELFRLAGHVKELEALLVSPDRSLIVTSDGKALARLWQATDGRTVANLDGHRRVPNRFAFSPDGRWLLSATAPDQEAPDNRILMRDLRHLDAAPRVIELPTPVESMEFAAGGSLLMVLGNDQVLRLLELPSGRQVGTLGGNDHGVWTAIPLTGTRRVATISWDQGEVRVWNLDTGRVVARWRDFKAKPIRMVADHTGRRIALGFDDGAIEIRDIDSIADPQSLRGHGSAIMLLRFSADGARLLSTSGTHLDIRHVAARIWSLAERSPVIVLDTRHGGLSTLGVSPDGALVASRGGGDLEGSAPTRLLAVKDGRELEMLARAGERIKSRFSNDGSQLAVLRHHLEDSKTTIELRDGRSGALRYVLARPDIRSAGSFDDGFVFSRDGSRLVAFFHRYPPDDASDRSKAILVLWDTRSGKEVRRAAFDRALSKIAVSDDGARVAVLDREGRVDVLNADNGQVGHRIAAAPDSEIERLSFARGSGDTIILAGETLKVASLAADGGTSIRVFVAEKYTFDAEAVSADRATLIAWGSSGGAVWELATAKPVWSTGDAGKAFVATASNREWMFASVSGQLIVRDAATGKVVATHHLGRSYDFVTLHAAFGTRALLETTDAVVLLDTATGDRVRSFRKLEVDGAEFSVDGRRLMIRTRAGLTALAERFMILDAASGSSLFEAGVPYAESVLVSPDGRSFVAMESTTPSPGASPDLIIHDSRTGAIVAVVDESTRPSIPGTVAEFTRDGRQLVVGDGSGGIKRIDSSTWRPIAGSTVRGPGENARWLSINPAASRGLRGDFMDDTLALIDIQTGLEVARLPPLRMSDARYSFSPNGDHLVVVEPAGSESGRLLIFRTRDGAQITSIDLGRNERPLDAPFAVSKSHVAVSTVDSSGPDERRAFVRVVRLADGEEVARLRSSTWRVAGMAWSDDDARLLTVDDDELRVWDVATAKSLLIVGLPSRMDRRHLDLRLVLNRARPVHVFGVGARRAAIVMSSGSVILFDLQTGSAVGRIALGHSVEMKSLTVAQSGRTLVFKDGDGRTLVRRVFADTADAVRAACAALPRALSTSQRSEFRLDPRPVSPACGRPPWTQEDFTQRPR